MNNDVTSNENQTQEQSEEAKTEEQPKAKEEPTVTKQIEKMRKRIDREVGQRKESEDENKRLKEQVKTLTEKLKTQQDDPDAKKSKNPELDKAMNENEKLKAQLVRRDQMDQVAQQFNEAGVVIPKDVLSMVVPVGIDDKQVSTNMKALSSFYDSIVAGVKKEFLSAPTPRTTGSDDKPFDKTQLRKIKDPVERVKLIKEHLSEFE
jgi:hypothetical protein